MFSADLIPCTLTLPLISLAQLAPTNASIRLATTAAFTAIPVRFISFLSLSDVPTFRAFGLIPPLKNIVDSADHTIRSEENGAAIAQRHRLFPSVLIFKGHLDVCAHQELHARTKSVARVVAGDAVR